jgi:hypothetical protein
VKQALVRRFTYGRDDGKTETWNHEAGAETVSFDNDGNVCRINFTLVSGGRAMRIGLHPDTLYLLAALANREPRDDQRMAGVTVPPLAVSVAEKIAEGLRDAIDGALPLAPKMTPTNVGGDYLCDCGIADMDDCKAGNNCRAAPIRPFGPA